MEGQIRIAQSRFCRVRKRVIMFVQDYVTPSAYAILHIIVQTSFQSYRTAGPKLQEYTLIVRIKAITSLTIILLRRLTPPLAPPLRWCFHIQHIILDLRAIFQESSLCRQQNCFRDDLLSLTPVRVVGPDDHRFVGVCGGLL